MRLVIGWLVLLAATAPVTASAQEVLPASPPTARVQQRDDLETRGAPSGEHDLSPSGAWSFSFEPYVWLPEMYGKVQLRRLSASFHVDYDQIFDLLGAGDMFAGMAHFEAQHERLSLFVDVVGGFAKPSGESQGAKIDSHLDFTYVEFGPAYRVFEMPSWVAARRPLFVEALAGGRFMYFYSKLSVAGNRGILNTSESSTLDWVDPFVGGRWHVPLVGDLDLFFRGDIGGFDAGSHLAWNVVSGFQYALPWKVFSASTRAIAGYRVLDFDYRTGSGGSRRRIAMNQRGPGLSIGFDF